MLPGILKEEYILNGTLSGQPAKNQGDERAKEKTHMLNERAVAVAISKLSLCFFSSYFNVLHKLIIAL